jgi:hypothetical protein
MEILTKLKEPTVSFSVFDFQLSSEVGKPVLWENYIHNDDIISTAPFLYQHDLLWAAKLMDKWTNSTVLLLDVKGWISGIN